MKTILTLLSFFVYFACKSQDSLYKNSETPAQPYVQDPAGGVELGMVLRSAKPGIITHFRYFKPFSNDGTEYTFNIYLSNGQKMASQKYSAPGKSGWQRIQLASPFHIEKDINYVVAYHTPQGYYGSRINVFSADRIRGNLTAPANSTVSGNGRYIYTTASTFPASTYRSSSYYVDIVFVEDSPMKPLIVNAGPDTSLVLPLKEGIQLNGVVTGDDIHFQWGKIDGPDSTEILTNSTTLQPVLTNMKEGTYFYTLTGWDKYGTSMTDTLQVNIFPDPEEVIMTIQVKRNGTWNLVENKLSSFFENRFFFTLEKK